MKTVNRVADPDPTLEKRIGSDLQEIPDPDPTLKTKLDPDSALKKSRKPADFFCDFFIN